MCFLNLNPRSESRISQFRITAIMLNKKISNLFLILFIGSIINPQS